jgi:hypothetical protein
MVTKFFQLRAYLTFFYSDPRGGRQRFKQHGLVSRDKMAAVTGSQANSSFLYAPGTAEQSHT